VVIVPVPRFFVQSLNAAGFDGYGRHNLDTSAAVGQNLYDVSL
jgi:hypothetical protein